MVNDDRVSLEDLEAEKTKNPFTAPLPGKLCRGSGKRGGRGEFREFTPLRS